MKRTAVVVLHIGYWGLYLMLIVCFIQMMPVTNKITGMNRMLMERIGRLLRVLFFYPVGTVAFLPGLIGFYSSYLFLFPRFLQRKRLPALFLSGALTAMTGGVLTFFVLYVVWVRHLTLNNDWISIAAIIVFLSLLTLVHAVIGLVLKGFITSYGDIQLKEDLNKKNYEMELALIKSQINPHFLFNTINNIDVLIGMDADKASAYLNKLSDIMRFMLYETKTEKITLAKELTYIEKYIDLQRIRTANPHYVSYRVEGDIRKLMIEPMLFIPFIENAFKHAADKKKEHAIDIRFVMEEGRIAFYCANNYNVHAPNGEEYSGLGNGLIRKRLELLYPGRHELEVTTENETYKAKLILITDAN